MMSAQVAATVFAGDAESLRGRRSAAPALAVGVLVAEFPGLGHESSCDTDFAFLAESFRRRNSVLQAFATKFAEAKVIVPDVFDDDRGFFKEAWSRPKYAALGLPTLEWEQDSASWSTRNVIRGMHYDFRMAKLVQCLSGRIFDAIVDLQRDSPTYLHWQGFILSASNHRQLYVPAGFAHGFIALADEVVVYYKNSVAYDAASEGAISWRNPRVGIEWPLVGEPRLSAKDAAVPVDALP